MLNIRQLFVRPASWGALVLLSLTLAACGPAPLGTSWPAISLLKSMCGAKSTESILVTFNDRIVQVDPNDGAPVVLKNSECEPRPKDSDGKSRLWDFRVSGKQFYSIPLALDNEHLLAIAYDQHMFKIDTTQAQASDAAGRTIDGQSGHAVADLVASDKFIYVGLNAKDLVALDRETLDVKWTAQTEHGVWGKPLLVEDALYFSSLDHNLYAIDANTGKQKWMLDLGGAAIGAPLFADGKLYVGSFARQIFEVSTDGKILNTQPTEDWVWGTPTIDKTTLYVADLAGYVYAFDTTKNLAPVWKQKVAVGAIRATPLIAGDFIIVAGHDQKVYWLKRADGTSVIASDGKPLVKELSAPILSDLLLLQPGENGVNIPKPYIVVSTTSATQLLAAYALDNGELKWSYNFQ